MCSIVPPKNPVGTVEHEEDSSNPPVTATSSLSPVSPEHEGLDRFHDCDDSHGKNLPVRKRKKGGIEGSASPSPDQDEDVGWSLKRVRQGDKDSKSVISNIKTEDPGGASRQSKTSAPDVVPWCPTTESGDSRGGSENEDLKLLKRPPMSKAREIRLEQNRKAARESRRRKKVMIEELQRSVIFFSRANGTLKQQNEELSRMLMQAQSQIVALEGGRSGNPQQNQAQNQGNNLSNQHTQQGEGSSGKAPDSSQQQEQSSSNAEQESLAQQSQDTKKNDNLKDSSQQQAQAQLQISLAQQAQAQAAAAQAMYGAHSFPPAAARTGAQTYAPAGGVPGAAPSPMASGVTGTPTPNMHQAMVSFQQAAAMQAAMQAMGMAPGPVAAPGGAPSSSPGTGAAGAAPCPAANTQQPNPQQAFQEMLSSFAFQQAQIAAFMQQQQQQQQQNPHMGAMQAAMAAGYNPAAAFSANPGAFAGFAAANPMAAASWQNGAAAAAAQQTSNMQNQQTDRS